MHSSTASNRSQLGTPSEKVRIARGVLATSIIESPVAPPTDSKFASARPPPVLPSPPYVYQESMYKPLDPVMLVCPTISVSVAAPATAGALRCQLSRLVYDPIFEDILGARCEAEHSRGIATAWPTRAQSKRARYEVVRILNGRRRGRYELGACGLLVPLALWPFEPCRKCQRCTSQFGLLRPQARASGSNRTLLCQLRYITHGGADLL
jgi:hypothetical protein